MDDLFSIPFLIGAFLLINYIVVGVCSALGRLLAAHRHPPLRDDYDRHRRNGLDLERGDSVILLTRLRETVGLPDGRRYEEDTGDDEVLQEVFALID